MARPLRIEFAGAIYHVTARGNERRAIVRDDVDRGKWLSLLDRTVERYGWRVFAFVLMDNHFHLFFQTPEPSLSAGMHHLGGSYAGYFNVRHRRSGHLFQGRFKGILVEDEGHWLELSRYVHLNPVRAGMAERPEDWAWSSYAGYHRPARRLGCVDYERVLAEFGGDDPAGRRRYRQYVAEGVGRALDSPLSKALHGLVLGSDRFVAKVRGLLAGRDADGEVPTLGALCRQADLGDVIAAAEAACGGQVDTWKSGRRCEDLSRAAAAYLARQSTGLTHREIAAALGYKNPSSVSVACRRMAKAMAKDRPLAAVIRRTTAKLVTNH